MNEEAKAECNHHYLTAYDTVYVFTESDIDICFEKVENIRFCPLCGMELKGKRQRTVSRNDCSDCDYSVGSINCCT